MFCCCFPAVKNIPISHSRMILLEAEPPKCSSIPKPRKIRCLSGPTFLKTRKNWFITSRPLREMVLYFATLISTVDWPSTKSTGSLLLLGSSIFVYCFLARNAVVQILIGQKSLLQGLISYHLWCHLVVRTLDPRNTLHLPLLAGVLTVVAIVVSTASVLQFTKARFRRS